MSQRKSVYSDILSKNKAAANGEAGAATTATRGLKKEKVNKATSSEYVKLTAYIPRDLHTDLKRAMLDAGNNDQSEFVEAMIRETIGRRHSVAVPKHSRATG